MVCADSELSTARTASPSFKTVKITEIGTGGIIAFAKLDSLEQMYYHLKTSEVTHNR